jgi:hypothetical protein
VVRRLLFLLAFALVLPLFTAPPASAIPPKLSPNGTLDFAYGASVESHGGPATGYKPESKLFYTGDGTTEPVRWWGVFGTSGAQAPSSGIWLWELVDHAWVARIKLVGADVWAKADVVFDGSTAYVSLRDNGNSVTGNPRQSNLYRLPYLGGGNWGTILGPTLISNRDPETLTIAEDGLGRVWSTYEDGLKIKVGSTAPGGTTFTYQDLPVPTVKADDISTIVAFGGDRIGVAWSNQAQSKFFFAWRHDSDPINSWTIETMYGGGVGGCPTANGTSCADDHLNMTSVGDEVYLAVKTSLNDQSGTSADPLNLVLRRNAAGTWAAFPVSPVSMNATRPILVVSPSQDAMWVFATRGSEVDVWESSFSSPSFTASTHPVWVKGPAAASNPTGTKQPTTAATGTVVLTSIGGSTDAYYHNEFLPSGPPPPPNTTPVANGTSTTTDEDTAVGIELSGTDVETCELSFSIVTQPAHGSLSSIANSACLPGVPNTDTASVTYTPAPDFDGSDSFTFRVNDGTTNSSPATVSITVTGENDPPTANDGSAATTTGTPVSAPLTASDPDTCQLTFSIESQPAHGILGAVNDAACSTGAPNIDSASVQYTPDAGYTGPDSFTFSVSDGSATSNVATISLTVSAPGAGITFRAASQGSNTTSTLDIAAPAPSTGDVMVAVVDVRGTPAITPPSGWTLIRVEEIATTMRQALYVRVAGGSEPSTYTWTFSKIQSAAGAILSYAGVDPGAPIDAHSGAVNDVTSSTVRAPSVPTSTGDEMVLAFFGITGMRTFTAPAGMTERSDISSTGGTYPISSSTDDVKQAAAGPTGDKIATASGTGKSIGQLVVLRPD